MSGWDLSRQLERFIQKIKLMEVEVGADKNRIMLLQHQLGTAERTVENLRTENKRLRTALEEAIGALDSVADVREGGFQAKLGSRWLMTQDVVTALKRRLEE